MAQNSADRGGKNVAFKSVDSLRTNRKPNKDRGSLQVPGRNRDGWRLKAAGTTSQSGV